MKRLCLVAAAALPLGIVACSDGRDSAANQSIEASTNAAPAGGETTTASVAFPRGARIVEEDGVTFRIDPDGTRIRLGDADSRILVEDNVRFRVDPDGTRVRIDPEGAEIAIDDNVRARVDRDAPAVELNSAR